MYNISKPHCSLHIRHRVIKTSHKQRRYWMYNLHRQDQFHIVPKFREEQSITFIVNILPRVDKVQLYWTVPEVIEYNFLKASSWQIHFLTLSFCPLCLFYNCTRDSRVTDPACAVVFNEKCVKIINWSVSKWFKLPNSTLIKFMTNVQL